ncbi:hypothetical protein L6Q85_15935 [bacterium]|nr:hypothetical protein [bacterium]NUP93366.1 hypothetical protein [Candidatus Omnitrophota bacterium]
MGMTGWGLDSRFRGNDGSMCEAGGGKACALIVTVGAFSLTTAIEVNSTA